MAVCLHSKGSRIRKGCDSFGAFQEILEYVLCFFGMSRMGKDWLREHLGQETDTRAKC